MSLTMMVATIHFSLLILLLAFVAQSTCINVLFVTDGAGGHMTPMFELVKAMKTTMSLFLYNS